MDESLFWTIVGGVAGGVGSLFAGVGLYIGWRQLRIAKVAVDRIIDVQLWRHGDRSLEAYVTLRNGGIATAIIDRIEVTRPRKTKVAWHFEPGPHVAAKTLKDTGVSNAHDVRIIVEPGKAGGCGMVMELPKSADLVALVKMRVRISANDLTRRYVWRVVTAKPGMATDQRPINAAIRGIPEDARP